LDWKNERIHCQLYNDLNEHQKQHFHDFMFFFFPATVNHNPPKPGNVFQAVLNLCLFLGIIAKAGNEIGLGTEERHQKQ